MDTWLKWGLAYLLAFTIIAVILWPAWYPFLRLERLLRLVVQLFKRQGPTL
jgi:hypothetical protein